MSDKTCRQREELRDIKERLEKALSDIKGLESVAESLRPSERLLTWIDNLKTLVNQLEEDYLDKLEKHEHCPCTINNLNEV